MQIVFSEFIPDKSKINNFRGILRWFNWNSLITTRVIARGLLYNCPIYQKVRLWVRWRQREMFMSVM